MSTVHCPCGLNQAELDAHGWVNNQTGLCTAKFKLNGVVITGCGELYADHPSAPQSKCSIQLMPALKPFWNHIPDLISMIRRLVKY